MADEGLPPRAPAWREPPHDPDVGSAHGHVDFGNRNSHREHRLYGTRKDGLLFPPSSFTAALHLDSPRGDSPFLEAG